MTTRQSLSIIISAAALTASGINATAQSASGSEYQVLLPSPGYATPVGEGLGLIKDPFSPNGLLLGIYNFAESAWTHTVSRITPTDPGWTGFSAEGLDAGADQVSAFANNPGDRLYAVGRGSVTLGSGRKATSVTQWKVRSASSATSWSHEDSFALSAIQGTGKNATSVPQFSAASGITTDSDGTQPGAVYVCGTASDASTRHWIVRKKSIEGTWKTVYDAKSQDTYSCAYSACYFPGNAANRTPGVFVVGILNDTWTVLRSQDSGTTWQTVGDWPVGVATAYHAACDSMGTIYVAGVRGRNGANAGWVLRRSGDGGATWETLLDQPGSNYWLSSVAIDDNGTLTLTGNIPTVSGSARWAVVRNSVGQTWTDSWANRNFPLGDTRSAGADALGFPDGSVVITGRVTDPATGKLLVGLLRLVP